MNESSAGVNGIDLAVVVVAHNPGVELAHLCAALCPQVSVLIVDNASSRGRDILEQCAAMGAEILRRDRNEGVAGGLAHGHSHFRGHEWILTFDQDSVVGPEFLDTLTSAPELSDARVAMVGPAVVDAHSSRPLQAASSGDVRFVITSGALCRVEALNDIGGFRRELFIDHVDHDVCLRLRRRGWRLRIAGDAVMRHSIGAMRDHHIAGPVSVRNSHHSAQRQYYKYRNYVLLVKDGAAEVDRRWVARTGAALAWGPLKIALFEEAKVAKVRAALAGLRDGLRGVSGPRAPSSDSAPGRHGRAGEQASTTAPRPRVLLIASEFFGYHRHIARGLEKRGFEVDHFNDRPSENPFLKAAIRVRPHLVDSIVTSYLDDVLSQTRGRDYDLVLVLNGKALTPTFVEDLLKANPRAHSVLYLWDAIKLYPGVLSLAPYFDRRFTFDSQDARTQPEFELLPLFFSDAHRSVGESVGDVPDYDIVNVCTAHPNRYALMKGMIPRLRSSGLSVFSYLYVHPLQFLYNKSTSEEFTGARVDEFHFQPLATSQYIQLLRRTTAVLDVSHAAQTGLTMRTIETMGARRKLITTNAEVVKYALYHPSRILVVEDEHLDIAAVRQFLSLPQEPLDAATYERFSLDAWLSDITTKAGGRHGSLLDH